MATLHVKTHEKATVTTTGASAVFRNPGTAKHHLIVDVASTPTGTTPTLTFEVDVSTDGITFTRKGGAIAALNAIATQRTIYGPGTVQGSIVEPFVKIVWTAGGTTPSFTNVSAVFEGLDC